MLTLVFSPFSRYDRYMEYNHKDIEKKWQNIWEETGIYNTDINSDKEKVYLLIEFPYPSGDGLHVGHVKSYTAMDIVARKKRAEGKEVLYPIGWDAFGLPAENYAIKTGIHPSIVVKKNIDNFRKQLKSCGLSFDWNREVDTTDPAFYKWSQWIFLKLYENGLAYKKKMPVNWCPKDKCVLANEEVVDGCCERCGTPATKRDKEQWMLAITKYAERLDRDLDDTAYLPKIKAQQRNWIGISVGSEITFQIQPRTDTEGTRKDAEGDTHTQAYFRFEDKFENQIKEKIKTNTIRYEKKGIQVGDTISLKRKDDSVFGFAKIISIKESILKDLDFNIPNNGGTQYSSKDEQLLSYKKYYGEEITLDSVFYIFDFEFISSSFKVFTTRADTIFGCTYCVLAPEHALVDQLIADGTIKNGDEVIKYREEAKLKKDFDRSAEGKEKTGVRLDGVMAINPASGEELPLFIADYVLPNYGTGAIMAVPAHDERDFAFAEKYDIAMRTVINPVYIRSDVKEGEVLEKKNKIVSIVENTKGEILCVNWGSALGGKLFLGGTIEKGESESDTALRELAEETGYCDAEVLSIGEETYSYSYYAMSKNKYFCANTRFVHIRLRSETKKENKLEEDEKGKFEILWLTKQQAEKEVVEVLHARAYNLFIKNLPYQGDETLFNSGVYNGMGSVEAREKITEAVGGKVVKKSKLRDWVFARQRYWGEPIPIVYDENNVMYPVAETEFPITLPMVDKFEPTDNGESPLALAPEWVHVNGYLNQDKHFVSVPSLGDISYHVNEPLDINDSNQADAYVSTAPIVERSNVACIIKHPTEDTYLLAKWKQVNWSGFVTGGIESGATDEDTARNEVTEETSYSNIKSVEIKDFSSHGLFYHVVKKQNRFAHYKLAIVELADLSRNEVKEEEKAIADFAWVDAIDVENTLTRFDMKSLWQYYRTDTFDSNQNKKIQKFRRETDTMPQWAGSSWYFMRYIDTHNDKAIGDRDLLAKWLPVDWYNGGMEHTTLHLLYSRFWYKFLYDIGVVPTSEPYYKRTSHGMILGDGGVKMSKSLGNVINPDSVIEKYGADTLRLYEMFMGPFDQAIAWDDKAILGPRRFLERVYALSDMKVTDSPSSSPSPENGKGLYFGMSSFMHKTCKVVLEGIDSMSFNTGVSQMMIALNALEKEKANNVMKRSDVNAFIRLLALFAPHIGEELWQNFKPLNVVTDNFVSVHQESLPVWDEAMMIEEEIVYALQINGKLRDTFVVHKDDTEEIVKGKAQATVAYEKYVGITTPKKVIIVKGKLVNVVM